jgi:hypothetical protein
MIPKAELLTWLKKLDKRLERDIVIVAVGGTAMTLLGLKSTTIDVDFCISSHARKFFEDALDKKFKVDIFLDGYIFSEQLPRDYVEKAKEIARFTHVTLKVLSPEDIVITKTARLNARDEEDIRVMAKYVNKEVLRERFEQVVKTYAGNDEQYRRNFNVVMKYL